MKIEKILGRQIYDSRGFPTVEVDVLTEDGHRGRASVPSGASKGSNEALELRDGGSAFLGKGVTRALGNVQRIARALEGMDVDNQEALDRKMCALDGTELKGKLGANAIVPISIACARANAAVHEKPLYVSLHPAKGSYVMPTPMINVINGGRHSDAGLSIQEFLLIPRGKGSFRATLAAASEVFLHLRELLKRENLSTAVGDEGGFAPHIADTESVLSLLVRAIERAGLLPGKDIYLGVDCAASEYYDAGIYKVDGTSMQREEYLGFLKNLLQKYPIVSIEDAMSEGDAEGWSELTALLGKSCQIVGDDVFVTQTERLREGIENGMANAVLIKPNQVGTLTETFAVVDLAKEHNYGTVISHRSGETEDTAIADLAVAMSLGQIKTGSLSRSERVAKYNRLLRIEEELGSKATMAKRSWER